MEECVDGEYQVFKSRDGAYIREKFFGRYPETAALVEDWSDEKIWRLTRGGLDPSKVYAAYDAATKHRDQPTCILAKTVKGYGMGHAGEGTMLAHSSKKMDVESLRQFRDRFKVPVSDEQLTELPFVRFRRGRLRTNISTRRGARLAVICRRGGGSRRSLSRRRRSRCSSRSSKARKAARSRRRWRSYAS